MKIFIIGSLITQHAAKIQFDALGEALGRQLAQQPVTVMLCSPYPDSCDANILCGIEAATPAAAFALELHYPRRDTIEADWHARLATLSHQVSVRHFGHEALAAADETAVKYSWLLSQLRAMEAATYIVLLGGRLGGSSDLLIRLAEAQQRQLVPLPQFGGVGAACFTRQRYQLRDAWGEDVCQLLEQGITSSQLVALLVQGRTRQLTTPVENGQLPSFFISYSRERPAEADLVEMVLRRRNYEVLRDEQHFLPSEHIPQAIQDRIRQATVFIALWCQEYACSPWCYDELTLALDDHLQQGKALWIFNLDATRMVHPKARDRVVITALTRRELDAELLRLLTRLQ